MAGELTHYRASGRTSVRFVPALVLAAALAIGLGWAYQALTLDHYVFLDLVAYVGFVAGTLAAVVIAGRLGKNRHRGRGVLAGLVLAALALAAAYYFDWRAMARDVPGVSFGDFLERRRELGWTLGRRAEGQPGTITGAWVWLVWLVEAVGVVAPALALGGGFGPFCERCGRWMDVVPVLRRTGVTRAATDALAQATTLDALLRVPPAGDGPYTLVYKAHRCQAAGRARDCTGAAYLTITRQQVVQVPRPPVKTVPKTQTETLQAQVTVPDARLDALAKA